MSLIVLSALGAISAVGATSAVTGDASALTSAVSQAAPHGLQVALSHVPSWTHAHQVLSEHLSEYAKNGSAGAGGAAGIGALLKRGLAHGAKLFFR